MQSGIERGDFRMIEISVVAPGASPKEVILRNVAITVHMNERKRYGCCNSTASSQRDRWRPCIPTHSNSKAD